jgi:hypothetical protein
VASGDRWFAVAYRLPAALARYDVSSGAPISVQSSCGDADDLFVDATRIYVICGAGHVDVVPLAAGGTTIRVATANGARTGFFAPELRMLFIAAPARDGGTAKILIFRSPKDDNAHP